MNSHIIYYLTDYKLILKKRSQKINRSHVKKDLSIYKIEGQLKKKPFILIV